MLLTQFHPLLPPLEQTQLKILLVNASRRAAQMDRRDDVGGERSHRTWLGQLIQVQKFWVQPFPAEVRIHLVPCDQELKHAGVKDPFIYKASRHTGGSSGTSTAAAAASASTPNAEQADWTCAMGDIVTLFVSFEQTLRIPVSVLVTGCCVTSCAASTKDTEELPQESASMPHFPLDEDVHFEIMPRGVATEAASMPMPITFTLQGFTGKFVLTHLRVRVFDIETLIPMYVQPTMFFIVPIRPPDADLKEVHGIARPASLTFTVLPEPLSMLSLLHHDAAVPLHRSCMHGQLQPLHLDFCNTGKTAVEIVSLDIQFDPAADADGSASTHEHLDEEALFEDARLEQMHPIVRWQNRYALLGKPLKPSRKATMNLELMGRKAGIASLHVLYAATPPDDEASLRSGHDGVVEHVRALRAVRRLSFSIHISVLMGLKALDLTVLDAGDAVDELAREYAVHKLELVPQPSETLDGTRDHVWLVLLLRNESNATATVSVALDDSARDSAQTSLDAFVVRPHASMHVCILRPRPRLQADAMVQPIPTIGQRQFIRKRGVDSARAQALDLEAFWYKQRLLDRLRVEYTLVPPLWMPSSAKTKDSNTLTLL